MVINLQLDAAQDLGHVDPFSAQAEIFLEDVRIAEAPGNAHRHAAKVDIRFVFHPADRDGAARKAEDLFGDVRRDR